MNLTTGRTEVPTRLTWMLVVIGLMVAGASRADVGPNLVSNPDFATAVSGWAWSTALISHQAGDGVAGLGSAQASPDDDGNAYGMQCVDIPDDLAGSFFVVGGWVKPVNFDPVPIDSRPASQLNFYADDQCGGFLGVDGGWEWYPRRPMGEWRRTAWGGRAPAGTGSILAFVGMVQAPLAPLGIVRIDDAFLHVVDPPEGLVHLWPFEHDVRDLIGGAETTAFGSPSYDGGRLGRAISLDGVNDSVRAGVSIGPSSLPRMTMGAWVRADQTNARRGVLSHDDIDFDRTLILDDRGPGGEGWSAFTGLGVMGGTDIAMSEHFQFVAVSYDEISAQALLYSDGSLTTETTSFGEGEPFLAIGSNPNFDLPFDGLIDEVFVFDRVLAPEELDHVRVFGLQLFSDSFESGDLSSWSTQ